MTSLNITVQMHGLNVKKDEEELAKDFAIGWIKESVFSMLKDRTLFGWNRGLN